MNKVMENNGWIQNKYLKHKVRQLMITVYELAFQAAMQEDTHL